MKEFAVFFRPRQNDYYVTHIYVNAHTPDEALDIAKAQLAKTARLIRADESPSWAVTP